MNESRRLLVSKDIPLSRVGRLKSLFQLGKPIPVEELQLDGSRPNQEDGLLQAANEQNISLGELNVSIDSTINDLANGADSGQPRIDTAIVAKRFRSAKAIFDQIEQESRQVTVPVQSPPWKASKPKLNSPGNACEVASPSSTAPTTTDACEPHDNTETSKRVSTAPDVAIMPESPGTNGGRPKPLVTRPKPVLTAEQLRALQQRSPRSQPQAVSASPKAENKVNGDVESGDADRLPAEPRNEVNQHDTNAVNTITEGEKVEPVKPSEQATQETASCEQPPAAIICATETFAPAGDQAKDSVILSPRTLLGDISAESDSDALDTIASIEDDYEIDEDEDANEVTYEDEDDEENLRDFEDNERRLTLEYRLEQLEHESQLDKHVVGVDLHRLPDGNFYFDVPGLPSATRDGTIDAEADAQALMKSDVSSGGKKRVHFNRIGMRVYSTYAPFEYDRRNEDIDPIGASAEYELEKRIEKMEVVEVQLEKDADGLGISIVGMGIGAEAGIEKLGIFVKAVAPGGSASRDGRVRVCDQLIEVDSVSLVGVTQAFAAQVLRNTKGVVNFVVGRERDAANSDIARLISLSLEQDRLKQQRLAQLLQAAQIVSSSAPTSTPIPVSVSTVSTVSTVDTTLQAAPIATAEADVEAEAEAETGDNAEVECDGEASESDAGEYETQPSCSVSSSMINSSVNISSVSDSHYDNDEGDGDAETVCDAADSTDDASILASTSNKKRESWNLAELGDARTLVARFDELHARNVALEAELALLRARERDARQSQAEQKLGELIQIKVSLELQLQLAKDQLETERRQFGERESQLNSQLDLVTRKYKKVKRLYKDLLSCANTTQNTN